MMGTCHIPRVQVTLEAETPTHSVSGRPPWLITLESVNYRHQRGIRPCPVMITPARSIRSTARPAKQASEPTPPTSMPWAFSRQALHLPSHVASRSPSKDQPSLYSSQIARQLMVKLQKIPCNLMIQIIKQSSALVTKEKPTPFLQTSTSKRSTAQQSISIRI